MWGTFSQAGKACLARGERFPRREKLAWLVGNIFPGGKTLPRSWGTFSRAGNPCRARGEHFPGRENLAALRGNTFPGGKSLPGSWGTFSRAGKPCRARGERFPKRENLAALRGNTFTSMETLLRFAATLLRAWKPCCILRQHFYEHENLAAFCGRVSTIICSPPSFPIRPHQGVCDTPLQLAAKNLHEMMPSITASSATNGKNVGAYRIRPPHRRTGQTMGTFTEKRWIARHRLSPFAHIRAYAIRPYSFWRKTFTNRCHPSPHPERQMVNM